MPAALLFFTAVKNHSILHRLVIVMSSLLIVGTLEERGMLHWQAELGVTDEEVYENEKMIDKDKIRYKKLLKTIYTVPFSQKLSAKLPFLRLLPFYPK